MAMLNRRKHKTANRKTVRECVTVVPLSVMNAEEPFAGFMDIPLLQPSDRARCKTLRIEPLQESEQ
jgi:hypothetical protein